MGAGRTTGGMAFAGLLGTDCRLVSSAATGAAKSGVWQGGAGEYQYGNL